MAFQWQWHHRPNALSPACRLWHQHPLLGSPFPDTHPGGDLPERGLMALAWHPAAGAVPPGWGWHPSPALSEAGWSLPLSRGLCHRGSPSPERACGVPWSSCGTAEGDEGARMRGKGRRRFGGSLGVPALSQPPCRSRPRMRGQVCCLRDEVPDAVHPPPTWHLVRAPLSPWPSWGAPSLEHPTRCT